MPWDRRTRDAGCYARRLIKLLNGCTCINCFLTRKWNLPIQARQQSLAQGETTQGTQHREKLLKEPNTGRNYSRKGQHQRWVLTSTAEAWKELLSPWPEILLWWVREEEEKGNGALNTWREAWNYRACRAHEILCGKGLPASVLIRVVWLWPPCH